VQTLAAFPGRLTSTAPAPGLGGVARLGSLELEVPPLGLEAAQDDAVVRPSLDQVGRLGRDHQSDGLAEGEPKITGN